MVFKIRPDDAQTVVRITIDPHFFSDVGKCAVAIVAIEVVATALQATRAAGNGNAPVLAKYRTAERRQIIEIKRDVVGDVKIQVAVVIVIAKGGAGSPLPAVFHARFGGDVSKRSVTVVMK